MKRLRVVIFAKAPVPGLAKTRLAPALGAEGAARLARRMLMHTLEAALLARAGEVELCVTPAADDEAWRSTALPDRVRIVDQGEGDLGERLSRAARRTIQEGYSALLIGTDCPALTALRLREAALQMRGFEAVIWPTRDGGYALLGLHRFSPLLFRNIPWSTATVAAETEKRLARLGWHTEIGPVLPDIDEPGDLRYLPKAWWNDPALSAVAERGSAGVSL